jgi:dihydroxyacid dehydratase/phosphogluconate dehydratase
MQAAAEELARLECLPFAAFCSDPCDGRTQGTVGMLDSLAYRNDAATVLRRLIRSLPTRRGVLGVATCDKGLPAMMMALAAMRELPCVLVPGGVTLPPRDGEDAGKVQSIGARFAHGELTLEQAADLGCRACGSPGGGCQFLGTAATSQVIGEALGLSLPHAALTTALRHLSFGKHVAVLTDARFSGVSTGACIGHIGPEALMGGPIGRVRDGDRIRIVIDRHRLEGGIDLVGHGATELGPEEGARVLAIRPPRGDLAPDPDLPDDTRLWAALQQVGGGTWGGCVYDVDAIVAALDRRR